MNDRVFLPVRNNTTEGFEMVEKFVDDLTAEDQKYLSQKAKLQQDPGNEEKLRKLLDKYLDKQPEPDDEEQKTAE